MAVGLLYGEVGTLNLADLAVELGEPEAVRRPTPVAMLLLVAFGIKAGALSGLLLAAGVLPDAGRCGLGALRGPAHEGRRLRADPGLTLLFPADASPVAPLLLAAGRTMASGVLAAASQAQVRRSSPSTS